MGNSVNRFFGFGEFCYGYLDDQRIQNMKQYKYAGEDRSFYYKLFLSPFAQACVDNITPYWLAPNLITFLGFILEVLSALLIIIYCPSLLATPSSEAPSWIWLYCAFANFTYQTLDNMDGKQARRTGSSSVLGLIFDHGCDCFNVICQTITVAAAINTGATWKAYTTYFLASSAFYFNTWEEYYTGELILGEINGPSDGQLVIQIVFMTTYFFGQSFWDQEFAAGLSRNTCAVYGVMFACIVTLLRHVFNVVVKSNHPMIKKDGVCIALTRLIPYALINYLFVLWVETSEQDIFALHPLICIFTLGSLVAKLTVHLMLDHVTDTYHEPWRKTVAIVLIIACHTLLTGIEAVDEEIMLFEFFVLSVLTTAHLIIGVCSEVANSLEIPVFTIDLAKAKRLVYGKKSS